MTQKLLHTIASLSLVGLSMPAFAQTMETAEDIYNPAREIIADIHRIVATNGVQENMEVTLGGARQFINIRGADRNNPILIFVHGGPGAVETPIAWTFQRHWEDYFTVVQWDQRGAGKSYLLNDPESLIPTLSVERYRDDAIELIELLTKKFGKRKVVLLGHSWGTVIGLSVAAKRPDLLHVYVGMGQVIDSRENERVGMAWTIEKAKRAGDDEAVRAVEALLPYPDEGPFEISKADGWRQHAIKYGSLAANRTNIDFYSNSTRLSPEYTLKDRKAWIDGSLFSVTNLWPRLADLSFNDLKKVDVPVVMLLGRHDYTTASTLADRWLTNAQAPVKKAIWFENSAHLPMIEEPGRVFKALLDDVLPLVKE